MKAYIFLSVHEELFHRVADRLRVFGVTEFSGFAWGRQQANAIANRGLTYDPMVIFTRDLLPLANDGSPPDIAWLERRERELGISITRMLSAERHLLRGRTQDQILRMAEVALREIDAAYERARPDFVFTEDVSCFHSYVHYAIAKERGIPFWRIGTGRLPKRLAIYSEGLQKLGRVEEIYAQLLKRELTEGELEQASTYLMNFRNRPKRPPAIESLDRPPGIGLADLPRLADAVLHYFGDPQNPTATSPLRVLRQRIERIARVRHAELSRVFEPPVVGEKYVLYPLHFQPEASTLVQAPLYMDQVSLLQDMARSLPIGHRLYVKEHVSSRGRRPVSFYQAIRKIDSVRLLSPNEDTWALIRGADAIAVITGTVGWEGVMFEKPVVTFGDVFFNALPQVIRASEYPKDRWYEMFRTAIFDHQPNPRALLAYITAMHQGSFPGQIHNPRTFPHVLEDENVQNMTVALATTLGLTKPLETARKGAVR